MPVSVANVDLWGSTLGAVAWNAERSMATFEYTPEFRDSGVEPSPLRMPVGPGTFSFPELAGQSFYGLPGMLADALPDKFGNLLIDQWLVRDGRDPAEFSPVERLCYIGNRGMGALEFRPAMRPPMDKSREVDIANLVALASEALSRKSELAANLSGKDSEDHEAMRDILRVGTSAGGARAKAIIAFDQESGAVRSGQVQAPGGFTHWILKFDGVSDNRGLDLDTPQGYGRIEYAYSLMAKKAGLDMTECRLLHENDRSHFMTRRFDRTASGGKIFMQSLCALDHMDFNLAGAYGYEQALDVARRLDLPRSDLEQIFRRMVFNIMARNQDDHTKNISFLMDRDGRWWLAPAYDVTYSYNPTGPWTSRHQMTLNAKRDGFDLEDFRTAAHRFRLFRGRRLPDLMAEVDRALEEWPGLADQAGVPEDRMLAIQDNHRRLATLG